MDRFQELKAFIAVVEAGGFSSAARATDESQPAVSKAIGALEKRLGVALFNRSTRSVTLTDLGQRYYDRTKPLMDEMEAADGELTSSTLNASGLVRISSPSTFGRLIVLPLLAELLALSPGLRVDLVFSDMTRDMVDDRIDLAIRVGRVEEPDAIVRRLGGIPLVCVGSRRYFDQHGIPKVPADLVHHNCILYGGMAEGSDWPFVGPEGPFSVSVRGNLSSNSVETTRIAVRDAAGIGMFTKISLGEELRHPDIITILEEFIGETKDVSLVWPKRRFLPARVRLVTDFFAKAIPQYL